MVIGKDCGEGKRPTRSQETGQLLSGVNAGMDWLTRPDVHAAHEDHPGCEDGLP